MALSDELTKLSARAKEAEEHAAAAQGKAKTELEQEVKQARESAATQADKLRASADAHQDRISAWCTTSSGRGASTSQRSRTTLPPSSPHDLDSATRRADNAEEDALFAIDYAYAAIDEAEYAVLDAALARMEADEQAAD